MQKRAGIKYHLQSQCSKQNSFQTKSKLTFINELETHIKKNISVQSNEQRRTAGWWHGVWAPLEFTSAAISWWDKWWTEKWSVQVESWAEQRRAMCAPLETKKINMALYTSSIYRLLSSAFPPWKRPHLRRLLIFFRCHHSICHEATFLLFRKQKWPHL